ncbi:MAG: DUF3280 domain-containing protein [Dongiaceae bacterium]
MSRPSAALALALLLLSGAVPAMAAPQPIALFPFELIDTSLSGAERGTGAAEQRRLGALDRQLRDAVAQSARYRPVDLAAEQERIAAAGRLSGCGSCAAAIAKAAGASLALTGTVQKVSELILNINLFLWDAASGRQLRAMSVDIRGNTDESWTRGLHYLLRNVLLAATPPTGDIAASRLLAQR